MMAQLTAVDWMDCIGLLALAMLWVNTLTIVGHAMIEFGALSTRRRRLTRVRRGTVRSAGALAQARIVQVGRSKGDGRIHFHDRRWESRCMGGALEIDGETLEVPGGEGKGVVEVWTAKAAMKDAALCRSDEDFDSLYPAAQKARGAERVLQCELAEGDQVWLVPAADGEPLWLSALDPARWITRKQALLVAFIIATLLSCAACSVLALWPPVYGTISTLGGALCLGFFLLVQPAGVSVSRQVLPPHRPDLGGQWVRPGAAS